LFSAANPLTCAQITLIREKLSYKIIFQNTTFLFSPLKLKNNFMKKSNLRNPFPFLKLIKLPTYTVYGVQFAMANRGS
jgi:hypothetical protein